MTPRSTPLACILAAALAVATATHAAELPGRTVQTTPTVSPTPIQAPSTLQCAAKGYLCGTGFTCTTSTTALGPSPDPQMTLLYACMPIKTPTTCSQCPSGWSPQAPQPDGSFACKATSASCGKNGGIPLPAGAGHYCGIFIGG